MCDIDQGYKYSVEVLLNLNHDRYKTYFAQFIILQLGVFTAMSNDKLSSLLPLLTIIGIFIGIIWLLTLRKINADIRQLWNQIKAYEESLERQSVKVHESRARAYAAGKWMLSVPCVFIFVHAAVLLFSSNSKSDAVISEGPIWFVEYELGEGKSTGFTRSEHAIVLPGGHGGVNVEAHGKLTSEFLSITYPERKDMDQHLIPVDRLLSVQFENEPGDISHQNEESDVGMQPDPRTSGR